MDFTKLKNFMDHLTSWRIPGNDIRVFVAGNEVFRYQSGYADLATKEKMTDSKHYFIYSCSKPATMTAVLQLLDQGVILLSDPVSAYIPAFKDVKVRQADGSLAPAKTPITIRHLLSMTAGLNYNTDVPFMEKARALTGGSMDTFKVISCLAEEPLDFEPGDNFQYSLCHDAAAAVVEAASGMKFRDYMKKNIFDPLEMGNTAYHPTDAMLQNMASQYRFVPDTEDMQQTDGFRVEGGVVQEIPKTNCFHFGPEYDSGGAGIVTTVDDYAKFVCALANMGTGRNGARILSPAAVDLMRTNQLNEKQLNTFRHNQYLCYGYGLGVRTMMDRTQNGALSSAGEFGWGGAAGATVLADPEKQLAVFYTHHMMNPLEEYYQPRLRNVVCACL